MGVTSHSCVQIRGDTTNTVCPKSPHSCSGQGLRSLCFCWWVVLTDWSTHKPWVLMTTEHKPLCPLSRCCDLGGPKARPVMPRTPQSPHSVWDTPCLLSPLLPLHSNVHSTHALPVQISAWRSWCQQAKARPVQQKQQCRAWTWRLWDEQHKSSVCLPGIRATVCERALIRAVLGEAWPHIAPSRHAEPNRLVTWLNVHFMLYWILCTRASTENGSFTSIIH